jgi:hypothetical protein
VDQEEWVMIGCREAPLVVIRFHAYAIMIDDVSAPALTALLVGSCNHKFTKGTRKEITSHSAAKQPH